MAIESGNQSEELMEAYPRPQLQRKSWISLDGAWDFSIDPRAEMQGPRNVEWDRKIVVPFAPET